MLTLMDVEFTFIPPVQPVNESLEVFIVTLEGLVADTVTIEFGAYQPLVVVVPMFGLTLSKYCVP
jgi:hypothetical protein